MTEESDWSYASKQKLAVVKAIKGNMLLLYCLLTDELKNQDVFQLAFYHKTVKFTGVLREELLNYEMAYPYDVRMTSQLSNWVRMLVLILRSFNVHPKSNWFVV